MKKPINLGVIQVLGAVHLALYSLASLLAYVGATGGSADVIAAELQVSKEELLKIVLTQTAIFLPLVIASYALIYIAVWKRSRVWFIISTTFFGVFWSIFYLYSWAESGRPDSFGVIVPIIVMSLLFFPKSTREYFDRK
jgi:hypothetical protein